MSDSKEIKQLKHIVCLVEKILFRDDDTGRTIMSVVKNDGKHTRLLGKTSKVVVGSVLKATGSWSKDEKYGWQFNAEFIQVVSVNPQADESEYLECNVKSIKVIKAETGFAIATVEGADGSSISLKQNSNIKLSGRIAKVRQGARIGVYGKWKHDDRYGDELQVSAWEYVKDGEDSALKLAAEFLKHLKPEESASECANAEEENGETKETSLAPTVFTLDSDLSKRAEIQSITILDSIVTIEKETFVGCNNLTEIVVSEGNCNYASIDGVLFNKDITELICFPSGRVGAYTIPDTVVTIADWAFCGCLGLTEVEIPESVVSIGEYSFAYCSGLRTIDLPANLKDVADRAFLNCFRLSRVRLNSIHGINPNAFENCKDNIVCRVSCIPWSAIRFQDYHLSIPNPSGERESISCNKSRGFMNDILERLSLSLPDLKVIFSKGTPAKIEHRNVVDDVIAIIRENIIVQEVEIAWEDVKLEKHGIIIPGPCGEDVHFHNTRIMLSMKRMLKRLSSALPKLIVRFEEGADPVIVNEDVLDDVITILTKRTDYGNMIERPDLSNDLLKAINIISKKDTQVFVPRDMTPYLDFLSEHQAIEKYRIVPVEEYIGGSYEDGTLFTIIKNGLPYIVWENNKDSRSTYVFRCTEDNYEDMRQRIFDYIMTHASNKRQFLRLDKCKQIFGQKPRMIVHNNLESWSQRLMSEEEFDETEEEENFAPTSELLNEQPYEEYNFSSNEDEDILPHTAL